MIPMKPTTLSQLAVVSAGQGAPKDNEFSESGVPFVRAGSLEALLSGKKESELELVSPETAKLRKLKTYPKGTILFAKSGMSATKDRVYVLQNPAHVVSHLATLIPKDGAHVDYLRLALKRFPPSSLIKDPAYPAIGLGEIQNFEIPVPEEFDDQIRIAHLLGKVEGLIAQRKQHLQQLDDLLKSVFLEMFGDPARNEKGWDKATFGHFAKQGAILGIQDGNHGNDHPKVSDFSGTGLPFVTANVVRNGRILFDKCYYLPPIWLKKLRIGFARAGDVLLSHKGTLGLTAVLNDKFDTYIFSPQTTYYRVDPENILPAYLKAYFDSDYFQWLLRKEGGNQATRAYLGITKQKELPLMLPPITLQREFSLVASRIAALRDTYEQNIADFESLYSALNEKIFKGELDLSRAPLPGTQPEEEKAVAAESLQAPVEQGLPINLPDTDNLLAALESVEARKNLLAQWLDAYRSQLGTTPFSVQHFMAAAQTRLAELHPDNDFELGANDYEHIKAWVFDALAAGTLMQAFDDMGNRIELKAVQT
ncbi:restriction endonuclease subunit S [Curvibacter sp. APW13]|uniref:restriction endonuclease subunit S n=1 Tax=Curvibacter sp. APW13 TaxID=3077236 RepID=UPI0028DD9556|nr:restriction endonuclease subunit S [Curvibacter sp. APW13]MDT8989263.1 restriction endonuclease subunit S [Curvibacter sp. APW13]